VSRDAPGTLLQAGYRALVAGDLAAAERSALAHTQEQPADALGWHLLGALRLKQGRVGDAVGILERAAGLDPSQPMVQLELGNARMANGDWPGAEAAFAQAVRAKPGWVTAHFNRAVALRRKGELLDAARSFARAALADAKEYAAMQGCVECIAEHVRRSPGAEAGLEATGGSVPFTIVVCSPDEARSAAARARLAPLVRDGLDELLPVVAPASLASAYNGAARAARHEHLLFVHDDVDFISAAPLAALEAALRQADVVGLAGSQRASGPAVLWAGHPHLHGWVSYPASRGDGLEAAPLSLRSGVIDGMQALDGLLVACRREVVLGVGFDAATFDGFHFYDLDFCVRAHRAGYRLAVTTEVLAVHASRGAFGDDWQRYRERFQAKFPELSEPAGAPHWYAAPVPDAKALRAFYSTLREVARDARAPSQRAGATA
jgi:tetratricopeptide (TPR) repeat protein